MTPILYSEKEKEFSSQGIGSLTDAISCKVTEERNGSYELEMIYPLTGVHFSEIRMNSIILASHDNSGDLQPFRVYQITKPLNAKVTVYAEHISYQLSYIPVKGFTAGNVSEALQGLKTNSLEENPFDVWTDMDTVAKYAQEEPASFRSRLGGVEGSILDVYGGEYEFDRYIVKLHKNRGSDNGVTIEYGKNLTDLNQDEKISNVTTGIVPYWKDTEGNLVVLPEFVLESEYADKYPFKRTLPRDFSSEFDSQPSVDQLRQVCTTYMKNNLVGVPEISIDVSFVDLADTEEYEGFSSERINLCDVVTVKFSDLGIDEKAKVVKTEYDTLADKYDSISVGSARATFAQTISSIKESQIQQSKDFLSSLMSSLAHQKELMSGGLGGHLKINYVDGKPSEAVFGDTDDIKTMKHCLVINMNGIGFSDGYGKTPTTAWTLDGLFNADFINTGTLRAINIEGVNIKGTTIEGGTITGSEINGAEIYGPKVVFGEKNGKYRIEASYREQSTSVGGYKPKGVLFNSFNADTSAMFVTDHFFVTEYSNQLLPMISLIKGAYSMLSVYGDSGKRADVYASTTSGEPSAILRASDSDGTFGALSIKKSKGEFNFNGFQCVAVSMDSNRNSVINSPNTLNLTGKDVTVQGLRPVKCKDNGHEIYFRWNGSSLIATVDVTDVWSTSDRRLKDLIETINNDYLDAIGSVEIKQFIFTDPIYDKSIKHFGVIAQDVRKVLQEKNIDPESIAVNNHFDRDGEEYYGIDKEEFLMARVAYDEKRIKSLEERIEALERKINA